MRVLIVDDDKSTANLIRRVLAEDGYAIDVANTGEEGRLLALVNDYDGIVLDINLGDRNGFAILQEIRRSGKTTPVLLYSGAGNDESVVRGLDAGAEGYIVKPVSNDELRARVRSLLRRNTARVTEQIDFGDLHLNRLTRRVTRGSTEVDLTAMELRLLEHLMMKAGETVTRSELHDKVWDMHFDPSSNVVDAHVARLRKKLVSSGSSVEIATKRGQGFTLSTSKAPAANPESQN